MAIAEDKLQQWIEQTMQVAQNVEKPEGLTATQVLNALIDAIPHLQEDSIVFADMELNQLFEEAYGIIGDMGDGIARISDLATKNRMEIEAIAASTRERHPLL